MQEGSALRYKTILECTVCFSQSLRMTSVAFEYGSMLIQKKVSLSGLLIRYHSLCIQLIDLCLPPSTCQHTLTPLDCTEDNLLADLELRKRDQIKYPGACAQAYHSAMHIVMECLFGWDAKKQ